MKNKLIFAVVGAGMVTAAVTVGRKIYEIGLENGRFRGFIDGLAENAEATLDMFNRSTEIKNKYNELSDKYDDLLDEYNELREELENKEFYGG